MSTQANVLHDAPLRSEAIAVSPISPAQLFLWSARREIWDNRSLYLAPAIVAALVLLGFFFGPYGVRNLTYIGSAQAAHDRFTVDVPYDLASGLIMITALLVSVFYSADALYAERRDRSILFWRSLPVSDVTTVMAKASIPTLVLPVITFVLTVITHLVMALASSVVLLRLGDPVAPLWSLLALPQMWIWLLGHLLALGALWYAPLYAWFLLVSAWASRAPLLWAFLPPLALTALERIVFHTSRLGDALMQRLAHGNMTFTQATKGNSYLPPGLRAPSIPSLGAPELWLGLLAAACFLAAAVQFRRYRSAL